MDTQERWKIDVDRSTLRFSLSHKLLGEISGQFRCWGGQVLIDRVQHQRTAVRIWVDLSSIDTGSCKRDEEILRTELFDQRCEPAMEFDGERLDVDASDRLTLVGWLGIRALRKEISVVVDGYEMKVDASGTPRFVCTARASIARRAFGLRKNWNIGHWLSDQLLGETIDIVARVEATLENGATASPPVTLTALRSWAGLARAEHL